MNYCLKIKKSVYLLLTKCGTTAIFALALAFCPANGTFAQSNNDFFNSGLSPTGTAYPPGVSAAQQALDKQSPAAFPGTTEYSADEKRMQRKYRANLEAARNLVLKADKMIMEGKKKKNDKEVKKGQILKEIGEKREAELKANVPVPELQKP